MLVSVREVRIWQVVDVFSGAVVLVVGLSRISTRRRRGDALGVRRRARCSAPSSSTASGSSSRPCASGSCNMWHAGRSSSTASSRPAAGPSASTRLAACRRHLPRADRVRRDRAGGGADVAARLADVRPRIRASPSSLFALDALVLALRSPALLGRLGMTASAAQTWHYGLVARWWAEFNLDGPEIDYFRPFVEPGSLRSTPHVARGGCSCRYLHAGIDVDGCDISPDMLALARERAVRERPRPAEPLRAGDARARASAEVPDDRRLRRVRARRRARSRRRSPPAAVRASRARRHARPRQRGSVRPARPVALLGEGRAQSNFRASTATRATVGSPRTARSSSSARGSSRSTPSRNASSSRCEPGCGRTESSSARRSTPSR